MKLIPILLITSSLVVLSSCSSSGPKVHTQSYAQLTNTRDFEEEYDVVYDAAKSAVDGMKIEEASKDDGIVKTDWVMSTSLEKYYEYKVNGLPRKKFLQTRYQYDIRVSRKLGSVNVTVNLIEEIERVKKDGTFDSWMKAQTPDTARANEMLNKIDQKMLSRPNK